MLFTVTFTVSVGEFPPVAGAWVVSTPLSVKALIA